MFALKNIQQIKEWLHANKAKSRLKEMHDIFLGIYWLSVPVKSEGKAALTGDRVRLLTNQWHRYPGETSAAELQF